MRTPTTLLAAGVAATVVAVPVAVPMTAQADVSTKPVQTSAKKPASVASMGPSKWTGSKLRHPRGGKFHPRVVRWANLTLTVMDELHIPKKRLPGILAQMQQESSGNPKAVNHWDSNARRGTPSKGLLQVIAPTYRNYAKPGFKNTKYQTVPYTNIYASLNYVKDSYGYGKFKSWNHGANQGY